MGDAHDILSQPDWLLSGIDAEREDLLFTKTQRNLLESMAFHDGRTRLSVAHTAEQTSSATVAIEAALSWHRSSEVPAPPLRLITHTAFCGSTLLSRMLATAPGVACYREPQILVELAELKACGHSITRGAASWSEIVLLALQQFTKTWEGQSAAIIKPSNWANTLFSDTDLQTPVRAVMMTSGINDYLLAHLRGGRERISFSLRLLNHMATCSDSLQGRIDVLEQQQPSGLPNILHLLALSLQAQQEVLRKLNSADQWRTIELTKQRLVAQPIDSIVQASSTLDLKEDWYSEASLWDVTHVNAKEDSQAGYSAKEESQQDTWLRREYGSEIQAACDWFHQ